MAGDWFYEIGNEIHGPVTHSELQQKAAAGELVPHTPVQDGREGRWVFAETVEGLFQSSRSENATAPENAAGKPISDVTTLAVQQEQPTEPSHGESETAEESSNREEIRGEIQCRGRKSVPLAAS
jgi:hypothetical protein